MSIFSKSRATSRAGLTLVEVLFVMVVLGIMVGLVIGLGRYSDSAARIHQARADLGEWTAALGRWHDAFGEYPASAGLTNVVELASNTVAITRFYTDNPENTLDTAAFFRDLPLRDPWRQYYLYQGASNAASRVLGFDLFSAGPDGDSETIHDNVYFSN